MKNKPFKKNDIVTVIDDGETYLCYSQFAKRHLQYALRWSYRAYPNIKHKFKVLGVYKHCQNNKHDNNKYCVVIQSTTNKAIFFIGEKGIEHYGNKTICPFCGNETLLRQVKITEQKDFLSVKKEYMYSYWCTHCDKTFFNGRVYSGVNPTPAEIRGKI